MVLKAGTLQYLAACVPLLAMLAVAGSGRGVAWAEDDVPDQPTALEPRQLERALSEVYRRVDPATVCLEPSHGSDPSTTGIVVSPDGYVLHRGSRRARH